jgi:hypothetical protein
LLGGGVFSASPMYGQRALCITFQALLPMCTSLQPQLFVYRFTSISGCISWLSLPCSRMLLCTGNSFEILSEPTYRRLTHHLRDLWHRPSEGNGSSIHILSITKSSDQL